MMHSRRRLIPFIMVMASVMTMMFSAASVEARGRITTGNGHTRHFYKGERVDGAKIKLEGGRTGYGCHFTHAPREGWVTSGVINPYSAEINTPECKNTLMSPGPRKETGKGKWRSFQKGDHVLGFAIEINVGPEGRTYFDCAIVKATASGRVNSGVVNPSRFEIKKMDRRCLNTDNWNPGKRKASGDGQRLTFLAGDRILGAYIEYNDGSHRGPCYDRVADMDGFLISGVRNYWPDEDDSLSAC